MSVDERVNVERDALQLLGERGWCKRTFEDQSGRMCLFGALSAAHTAAIEQGHPMDRAWLNRVRGVVQEQFPNRTTGALMSFNDHPDTTVDDVVLVLEKAAIRRIEQVQP
jgi:hypothetical protein